MLNAISHDWEIRSTLTQNRIPSNHGIIIIFDPFYTILSEKLNLRRFFEDSREYFEKLDCATT